MPQDAASAALAEVRALVLQSLRDHPNERRLSRIADDLPMTPSVRRELGADEVFSEIARTLRDHS